jgi:CheY-like chemotaxis protein
MTSHILIIEDDADIRDVMQQALQGEGYDVTTVADPREPAAALGRMQPDLIVADIMLRGTSGIEVALALRADGHRSTLMIGMSASGIMAAIARRSGAFQEVIDKPFDLDDLFALIERLLAPE